MNAQEVQRIANALAQGHASEASAEIIAERVSNCCIGMGAVLSPIIGHRGVAALYKRALHMARASHAWLPAVEAGVPDNIDLAALKTVLVQQSGIQAAQGGAALLAHHHDVLTSLVGRSLTERLLRSVWVAFLPDPPVSEPLP